MSAALECRRPPAWPHHRSPYLRAAMVVVVLHAVVFVLAPPFHIEPYRVLDDGPPPIRVEAIDEIVIPDRPRDDPIPPVPPQPYPAPDGDDVVLPPTDDLSRYTAGPVPAPTRRRAYVPYDHEPVPVVLATPRYPDLAREGGMEGTVWVKVTVDTDGRVIAAAVIRSDVIASMEAAAVEAARLCRFEPARQGNRPVRVDVVIPFEFRLQDCR